MVACLGFASGRAQTAPASGQHADHSTPPAAFTGRIGLYKSGLGPFTRPISSKNREAQAFFNQGFQMMYAFAKPEAVRSFREAWKRDPNCAICYWGEAWAWGSYLNCADEPDEAPYAYAAMQKAVALASRACHAEGARAHRGAWRFATSRSSIRPSGSSRTAPTPTR